MLTTSTGNNIGDWRVDVNHAGEGAHYGNRTYIFI